MYLKHKTREGCLMNQTKTIEAKITTHNGNTFDETFKIYRDALGFIVDVIHNEWSIIDGLTTKDVTRVVERLIHQTKKNPSPKYNFTNKFYKFPSYFRRSAISKAFGIVQSYVSNLKNWTEEKQNAQTQGKHFNKKSPTLNINHNAFPVFYKGNMFERISNNQAKIKVLLENDWVWITISFNDKNFKNRNVLDWNENNPALVKKGKKYFIHFSYTKNIKLNKTKLKDQMIITVDLGLTNSAVCSAMHSDGTVIGRKFIDQPIEKDRMKKHTNKLRKAQSDSGWIDAPNLWRRINGLQNHIKVNTAVEIIKFAEKYNADVIVFEYLGRLRFPKGAYGAKRLRHRLHHWCQVGVQSKVQEMAHYRGIRIRRINPRNTSALAFDGTGIVKRNNSKDLATFTSGKVYHADLNASYNIGARYFIREFLKSFSEKKRSALQAKVPELLARTQQTLASLISLHQANSGQRR
jgi:IS605 OrfB family transposase